MHASTLERLMDEIGWPYEHVPDPATAFNIQVTMPEGAAVHAAVHQDAPHAVVVGAGQRLEDDVWAEARRLTRRDCARMAARLEQLLLVSEVEYTLKREQVGTSSCVREICVRSIVDEADLCRSTLRRHLIRAHRTRQLLRAVWAEFCP